MKAAYRICNVLLIITLAFGMTAVLRPVETVKAVTPVFVNEIHYDNTGTDAGEFIEVAGPAGTDISGWSVTPYNGNGGATYNPSRIFPAGSIIPDQGNGYGTLTLSWPVDGLQNGSPDGFILSSSTPAIIQFLCYEGTFVATNGPALGMTCTDIGVMEDSTTPVGYSLQLTGAGVNYEDFTWAAPADDTPVAINNGQVFTAGPYVTATTPADDAVDVAIDANISLTFSEAVNVSGDWVTVTCGATVLTPSGGLVVDETGDPTFVLNPSGDLPFETACDVTFDETLILADGDAAPMDFDYSFNFTTVDAPPVAPVVTATVPADEALDVLVGSNLSLTFSEPVNVAGDWVTVTCGATELTPTTGLTVDASGDPIFVIDPTADLPYETACTVTLDPALVAADDDGTLMSGVFSFNFTTEDAPLCGTPYTQINDIQGAGELSPLDGQVVSVEGIVTSFRQETTSNRGYFIQSLPADVDADPLTSEGLYVYHPASASALQIGDHVRVEGTADDYTCGGSGCFVSMTQVSTVTYYEVCASGLTVAPVDLNLPVPDGMGINEYFEPYEGMLVSIDQTLTVEQNYFQGRFGHLTVGLGRQFTPYNFEAYDGVNNESLTAWRSMLILDDNSHLQNPNPIPYLAASGDVRAGDTLTGPDDGALVGVLDQGKVNTTTSIAVLAPPAVHYRLSPVSAVEFTQANPRPADPPVLDQPLVIAGFNVLNYFTTLDMAPYRTTPPYGGSNTPRGADTAAELIRQQDKLVAAIVELDADVLGLTEIESWDDAAAAEALVEAINTALGSEVYAVAAAPATDFTDTTVPPDFIEQALIYKVATVEPVGTYLEPEDPIFDRQPLAMRFQSVGSDDPFWVVTNHFKSKSSCPASGDIDLTGEGCWNLKRVAQAEALAAWIESTLYPLDEEVLINGDLNAYGHEAPILSLKADGFTDLLLTLPEADRYTYVFDGQAGYLDHALVSPEFLAKRLPDAAIWHINADEPSVIDYNVEFKPVDLYAPDAYRASDHDPVLVAINVNPFITGQDLLNAVEYTPFTLTLDDFTVTDEGGTFPTGYSLILLPGDHYTIVGDEIVSDLYFPGPLLVNVQVSDGTLLSPVFQVTVTIEELLRLFMPVIGASAAP